MPDTSVRHETDEENRLIVITGDPAPAVEAAQASLARIGRERRAGATYGVLILVNPDTPVPAGNDVLRMAGLLTALSHVAAGPVALVVRDQQQAGVASMMALAGDGAHRVDCFSNERDARLWLQTQLGS